MSKYKPSSRYYEKVYSQIPILKEIQENCIMEGYFIANTGEIYRQWENNLYRYIGEFSTSAKGIKFINLPIKNARNRHTTRLQVDRLVLKYFNKGYVKCRHIKYIDGDYSNCALSNLKWKCGFNGDIDKEYIINIIPLLQDADEKLVAQYLLTRDERFVLNIIRNHKGLLYLILKDYRKTFYYKEILTDLVVKFLRVLDEGRYKPQIRGNVSLYLKRMLKREIVLIIRNEVLFKRIDNVERIETKHFIYNDDNLIGDNCSSIEDEIYEMFLNLEM